EMRERLNAGTAPFLSPEQSEGVLIRTFHSFGAWFLRRHAEAAGLVSSFNIYDDEDSQALLKQAVPGIGKNVKIFQRSIAKAKDSGIGYGLENFPSISELEEFNPDPDFKDAFEQYQKALARSGNADFADLLGLSARVLEKSPPIKQQIQRRFRRILVDEYQDSNPLQNRLLNLLLGGPEHGQELCIVGDEDQSIYGFRGAEIRHILEFSENFAPAQILRLEQNYRSRKPILDLANQVISRNSNRLGKTLQATKSGGKQPQFRLFESCEDEAVFIARCIRETPTLRTAILYRTNAQSRTFERILREWNIPYLLVGNLSFYRREEIKDVVAVLKCLANPRDFVSFARIYNKPKRGLGPRVLQSIENALESALAVGQAMRQVLEEKALAGRSLRALAAFAQEYAHLEGLLNNEDNGPLLVEFIQEVLERSGLWAYYKERDEEEYSERCLNFDSLLQEAQYYGKGRKALVAFLESIELETEELDREEAEPNRDAHFLREQQMLITMHNTKGLEFERVFVTGMELGVFPNFGVLDDSRKMEEERRLFYVAITRAEEELYLSAARQRMIYGNFRYHEISPLLLELGLPSCDVHTPVTLPVEAAAADETGAALAKCKELSPERLQEMRAKIGDSRPKKETDPFVVGARVEHLDYGLGYVVQRKISGSITTLMIKLDDGRLIRVQLEFQRAKLDFLGIEGAS
ncbi:MAG: ATP-dependent helicase, partial [Spirochaetota bacterium]